MDINIMLPELEETVPLTIYTYSYSYTNTVV